MKRIILAVIAAAMLSLIACSSAAITKADLKPTVRELGGGYWAFDRHPDGHKSSVLANEALQDALASWMLEHDELEIKMVLPLEFNKGCGENSGYAITSILVVSKRKPTQK